MTKFYPLSNPTEHKDMYGRPTFRVEAATLDSNGHTLYLHSDGKVKDGLINLGNPCTTVDFTSLDKAYLAINDYYVANGQHTPAIRVGGSWVGCGVLNTGQTTAEIYGQTSESVVDSSNESEPMDFE